MRLINKYKAHFMVFILLFFLSLGFAQTPLQKKISIQVKNQRLGNVLDIIGNAGNFNFSYNSNIIKRDSLVTIAFTNKPVKEILDFIFKTGYEYIESGSYIILRKKPIAIPPPQTIVKPGAGLKKYTLRYYVPNVEFITTNVFVFASTVYDFLIIPTPFAQYVSPL